MFRLPDFSVVVWLRKTDGFAALKGELLGAAATEPYESTEYQGMVDFHWSAANLPEATRRRAEGCRTTSGTRSVTDHEPGRWRGLSLDQRRATHETLTGVRLVLAAPTRLLLHESEIGTELPIRDVRCHGEYWVVERTYRGHRENGADGPGCRARHRSRCARASRGNGG